MTTPSTISIGSVTLPLHDFAVARTAILGITKSGKSYAAKGIAEQLLAAGIPIVVFDAIGVWRFLKTPGAGPKAHGYPVVIAGGAQGDLPLTSQSAPEIMRAAIRENIPLVIDLYDPKLSKADWRRIVQSCLHVLLYENKSLRHIFLEEAAEFAPQRVLDGQTYAEVEKLARMGGNVGLGITFINQRAQELNKAVLELCDNLVLLRQRGSHAITALEKWLDRVSPDTAREISKSLPHMEAGDCWVWAEASDHPVRTRTATLRSYHPDRRATQAVAPKQAAVDTHDFVSRLAGKLGALAEETKANDPTPLRRRITELEGELRKARAGTVDPAALARAREDGYRDGVASTRREVVAAWHKAVAIRDHLGKSLDFARGLVDAIDTIATPDPEATASRAAGGPHSSPSNEGTKPAAYRGTIAAAPPARAAQSRPAQRPLPTSSGPDRLPEGEQRILTAAAQYPEGVTREQASILAGYKRSTRDAYIQRLSSKGYLDVRSDVILATESGIEALGPDFEPLPTGEALREYWLERLPGGEREVFRVVIDAYPSAVARESVSEATGYKRSTRDAYLQRLATRKLLVSERGMVRASDSFSLESR